MIDTGRFDRRQLFRTASAAGISTWLGGLVARRGNGNDDGRNSSPYQRCITLWMQGGPSQIDTFDPKPGTETGGPMSAVATNVPGMTLCESLSSLAGHAQDLCLLRSVGSTQGEHERASHLLHTGFERIDSFPRPSLGAFVSNRFGTQDVPGFVTLGNQAFGPAFMGTTHGPFVISDLKSTTETIRRVQRRSNRLELIGELNARFVGRSRDTALGRRADQIESLQRLLNSPFADALDLSAENTLTRDRYGDSEFGRNVLVARRLLETGVKYVEVQMPGWDTHVGNFPAVTRLCQQLQPAWIALMQDLKSSGLWNDTLILWMGEFGRTPLINGQNGRDHYPQAIPVTLAGHSVGGKVIGSTGTDGRDHSDSPSSVADLMYTLMTMLGVDAQRDYITDFGSPTSATDDGKLIEGII
ncbi:MAG: DUF1501 domain-containing protein [Planctomycetales bacterium]|nr:DUF1501 domain-containing protein [Planctomycetales bacterium]